MKYHIEPNAALFIVDVQNGFINQHTKDLPSLISNFLSQVEFKNQFFIKFINEVNSPFRKWIFWDKMSSPSETDIPNILKELEIPFLVKKNYSPFAENNNLIYQLRESGVNEIYILGLETDICILKTAVDAFELKFRPFVLAEFCRSCSGQFAHESALKLMPKFIGRNQVILDVKKHFLKKYGIVINE